MKKLLIILFSFITFNSNAQFEIGLNGGVSFNQTNKSNENFYDFGNYSSFYPEINVGYFFNKNWGINWGLGFSSKGYKVIPTGDETQESESYCKFRYFSIPLYVSYQYPVKSFYGKFSIGLQPNFYTNQNTSERFEEDFQQMNSTIGLLIGAEIGYFLSDNFHLHLGYRYNPDLNYADELKKQGKFRSNYLLVGVSYLITSNSKK